MEFGFLVTTSGRRRSTQCTYGEIPYGFENGSFFPSFQVNNRFPSPGKIREKGTCGWEESQQEPEKKKKGGMLKPCPRPIVHWSNSISSFSFIGRTRKENQSKNKEAGPYQAREPPRLVILTPVGDRRTPTPKQRIDITLFQGFFHWKRGKRKRLPCGAPGTASIKIKRKPPFPN